MAVDGEGEKVWSRELDIYGKTKEETGKSNFIPFLYQGQYYDEEIELAYNRFRYYDCDSGTYISQDPIGLVGGLALYTYSNDVNIQLDILGLSSRILDKNLGGVKGDSMQAHHVIPEEVWGNNQKFLDDIGLGSQMDKATNGLLLPSNNGAMVPDGPDIKHIGSHPKYSAEVDGRVKAISDDFYDGLIDDKTARRKFRKLQMEYKNKLWNGDVPHKITDGRKKLH